MGIRRAIYRWQFLAAALLPLWLLVGWAAFGPDGWPLLILMLVCPILAIGMAVVGFMNLARASVRSAKAVSWLDVMMLSAWHASLIVIGFYTELNSWLIVVSVVIGLSAFWASTWQMAAEASRRVSATFSVLSQQAPTGRPRPNQSSDPVVIVHETDR